MRWFWIDRFTEFVSGQHATAIKNVSMAEEPLWDHFPGYPVFPTSLIVEGLAQTGGLLVAQHGDFLQKVVLAKVGKATFHELARPGDQLSYSVRAVSLQEEGSVIEGTCRVVGSASPSPLAEVQLVFAYLGERFGDVELFDARYLRTMLKTLRLFEIGRTAEGAPLTIPAHLSETL